VRHAVSSSPTVRAALALLAAGALSACGNRAREVGGRQVDCTICHNAPPVTGAHLAHSAVPPDAYGSTAVTADLLPADTATYAFGCGNCHPIAAGLHGSHLVDLSAAGAPAGSIKSKNGPAAAFNETTKTCRDVYCHSSGQANPIFVATPAWDSGATLGCDGCHPNPPNRTVDGAGVEYGNGHVNQMDFAADRIATGHFGGLPAALHEGSAHGGGYGTQFGGDSAAPITCQTCHFDTATATYTRPSGSGFYYWNPDGTYDLDPADPAYVSGALALSCADCHTATPPAGQRVNPYFHVNGRRDVSFDRRTSLSISGTLTLPGGADAPTKPYWYTRATTNQALNPYSLVGNAVAGSDVAGLALDGTTLSLDLRDASWNAGARTCSSVACHLNLLTAGSPAAAWGGVRVAADGSLDGMANCAICHAQ
jgi:predicted CxxxxCH...CXXCH cytochrome family protein